MLPDVKRPWAVNWAVPLLISSITPIVYFRFESVRDTSLYDEFLRDTTAMVCLAVLLMVKVAEGIRWAWLLVFLCAAVLSLDPILTFTRGLSLFPSSTTLAGLRAAACLTAVGLLFTPGSRAWFLRKTGWTWARIWHIESKSTAVVWLVFIVSLILLHFAYWDTVEFKGLSGRVARDGNGIFGLLMAASGIYLYLHYFLRSFALAQEHAPGQSPLGILTFALALLVLSVVFPAKSLSYAVILVAPVQLLIALGSWFYLLVRAIRTKRGGTLSKPYFCVVLGGAAVIGCVLLVLSAM